MTADEAKRAWKKQLARLNIRPKEAARRLKVNSQTAYNWNSGAQRVPEDRIKQLEEMVK